MNIFLRPIVNIAYCVTIFISCTTYTQYHSSPSNLANLYTTLQTFENSENEDDDGTEHDQEIDTEHDDDNDIKQSLIKKYGIPVVSVIAVLTAIWYCCSNYNKYAQKNNETKNRKHNEKNKEQSVDHNDHSIGNQEGNISTNEQKLSHGATTEQHVVVTKNSTRSTEISTDNADKTQTRKKRKKRFPKKPKKGNPILSLAPAVTHYETKNDSIHDNQEINYISEEQFCNEFKTDYFDHIRVLHVSAGSKTRFDSEREQYLPYWMASIMKERKNVSFIFNIDDWANPQKEIALWKPIAQHYLQSVVPGVTKKFISHFIKPGDTLFDLLYVIGTRVVHNGGIVCLADTTTGTVKAMDNLYNALILKNPQQVMYVQYAADPKRYPQFAQKQPDNPLYQAETMVWKFGEPYTKYDNELALFRKIDQHHTQYLKEDYGIDVIVKYMREAFPDIDSTEIIGDFKGKKLPVLFVPAGIKGWQIELKESASGCLSFPPGHLPGTEEIVYISNVS